MDTRNTSNGVNMIQIQNQSQSGFPSPAQDVQSPVMLDIPVAEWTSFLTPAASPTDLPPCITQTMHSHDKYPEDSSFGIPPLLLAHTDVSAAAPAFAPILNLPGLLSFVTSMHNMVATNNELVADIRTLQAELKVANDLFQKLRDETQDRIVNLNNDLNKKFAKIDSNTESLRQQLHKSKYGTKRTSTYGLGQNHGMR